MQKGEEEGGQFSGWSSFHEWLEAVKDSGFKSGVLYSEDMYRQALEVLSVAPLPDSRATNQPASSRFRHSIRSEKKWFLRHDGEGRPLIMGPGVKKAQEGHKGEDRIVVAVGNVERELQKMHVDAGGRHLRKGPLDKTVRERYIGISRLACEAFCHFCPVCSGKGAAEEAGRQQEQHSSRPEAGASTPHEASRQPQQEVGGGHEADGEHRKRQRSPGASMEPPGGGASHGRLGGGGGSLADQLARSVLQEDHPAEGPAKRARADEGLGSGSGAAACGWAAAAGHPPLLAVVGVGDAAGRRFEEAAALERELAALWSLHSTRRRSVRDTEDEGGQVATVDCELRSTFQSYPAVHERALRLRRGGATRDCVRLLKALSDFLATGRLESLKGTGVTSPTESYAIEVDL